MKTPRLPSQSQSAPLPLLLSSLFATSAATLAALRGLGLLRTLMPSCRRLLIKQLNRNYRARERAERRSRVSPATAAAPNTILFLFWCGVQTREREREGESKRNSNHPRRRRRKEREQEGEADGGEKDEEARQLQ